MAGLPYIKGVRTRFRNTLQTEINSAVEIIRAGITDTNVEAVLAEVSKCSEKLKVYSDKVEIQSEKMAAALGDKDSEMTNQIIEEDCDLCSEAMDCYFNLKEFKERIVAEKSSVKEEKLEDPLSTHLVKLQEDMQNLLKAQMKQEEAKDKKEKEKMSSVKLPKIEMASFGGDKTKWIEFWDSFQSAIHTNKSISNVEKFNYLRSKVFGEARSAIAGLALSNENYLVAVDVLSKRFGNPQDIVDLHYNQLINLQPASNKVSSLRELHSNVERHLRSLEVLKQNIDQDVFVSMVRAKLPEDVLLQLELRHGSYTKWTVYSLIKDLESYIVARERAANDVNKDTERNKQSPASSIPAKVVSSNKSGQSERKSQSTTQSLVSSNARAKTTGGAASMKKCRYCQNEHWSDECDQFKTISERKKRIKGSCFKCLREGHSFRDCKTDKSCVYCGEKNVHHRSLCPKKFELRQTVMNIVGEKKNVEEIKEESGMMSTNEMVLMQTASTKIKNPEQCAEHHVRLFLDSGSHRSYITQDLAERLELEEVGEQDIHVVTFGSTSARKVTTKYIKLDVKVKSGEFKQISANVVPVISGELQRCPVKELLSEDTLELMSSVQLADELPKETESSPIEFLIGNDYYLDFVIGEKIQLQDGLYLLSSKFGWLLTGRLEDKLSKEEPNMLILTSQSSINKTGMFSTIDSALSVKPDLEDFWKIESIGIVDKDSRTGDEIAMEQFKKTLKFEDNRYQVTWPWKDDSTGLPKNRELAIGLLNQL